MITTDEWGKTVFHIQTGAAGYKALSDLGVKSMSSEEYDKHMASYKKIQHEKNKEVQKWAANLIKMLSK